MPCHPQPLLDDLPTAKQKVINVLKRQPRWIISTFLLILAPLSIPGAWAEAPWYQFEIIIFERIAKGAGSTESWPGDPGTPSRLDARSMRLRAPAQGANAAEPVAYATLPKSEWQLTEIEQRLRRSRNYRPHVHLAWRQKMVHPDRAQLLHIEMMDRRDAPNRVQDQPKLEGTLKVGVRRYLHLETDLLLRRLDQGRQGTLGPYYRAYRMQSKRRMRSGRLHYLDHPLIGVLVLASRYQPPKPAEPEPIDPEVPEVPETDAPTNGDNDSQAPQADPVGASAAPDS